MKQSNEIDCVFPVLTLINHFLLQCVSYVRVKLRSQLMLLQQIKNLDRVGVENSTSIKGKILQTLTSPGRLST